MRNQVELPEVLEAGDFALKASIYKVMPGIVVAYYASSAGASPASVDVQPAIHDVRIDSDTGAVWFEKWPVISRVPLAMPVSAGTGAGVTFALTAGDKVTLLSWDLDPTAFRSTGRLSNPLDTGRHTGGHWLALPYDITNGGGRADPGGNLLVTEPAGGKIVVGGGASDFAALASKVDQNFTTVNSQITALNASVNLLAAFFNVAPAPVLSAGPGSVPLIAPPIPLPPPSVAASIVKVK